MRILSTVFFAAIVPSFAAAQTIRGTIVDSASGKGLPRARIGVAGTTLQATTDSLGRFTITGALSGEQTLAIHTPSLDSLNAGYSAAVTVGAGTTTIAVRVPNALQIAGTACGDHGFGAGGIVLGRLKLDGDSTASLVGTVSAEWQTAVGPDTPKWVSAMSDARGRFALCGVPLDAALTLRAVADSAGGQALNVRVPAAARFSRAELVLHRVVTTTATFAGLVTDSANKPIVGVEVTLPDLGKATKTNDQGAFVVRDVPAGKQRALVRHVGYGPVETQLTFAAGQTVQRRIALTRSTTLDSVVVTEKAVDHQLDDFEENKKLGLGHFLTREELATQEGRPTSSVLASFPGIKVATAGPHAWIGSGHNPVTSLKSGGAGIDEMDAAKHAPQWNCYALVYLDDHPVFRGQKPDGKKWEPLFDINSIPVSQIEAIEY